MLKIQVSKNKKVFLFNCLILFVLGAFFFVMGRAVWFIHKKNQLAQNNLDFSVERLEDLEEREEKLQDKIEKLKTERGIEDEIRTSFPVVKPGEKVISIVENPEVATTVATSSPKTWWQALFDF